MMTQDRAGRMRVISLRAVALALAMAAACWVMALQTDGQLDACRVKRDYEVAKRAADQAAQEFGKLKSPPEAKGKSQLDDAVDVHDAIYSLKDPVGVSNKEFTYEGHGTSYRQRIQKLLGITREDYIDLYDVAGYQPPTNDPNLLPYYIDAHVKQAKIRVKEIEARGKQLEKTDPELGWIAAQIKSREDWLVALKKLTDAQSRVDELKEVYGEATAAKNAALAKARGDLDSVGTRFNQERDRLQALPHDDSYLQQSLQLIART